MKNKINQFNDEIDNIKIETFKNLENPKEITEAFQKIQQLNPDENHIAYRNSISSLAQNPNTPEEILEKIYQDENYNMHNKMLYLAQNPNLSKETTEKLAQTFINQGLDFINSENKLKEKTQNLNPLNPKIVEPVNKTIIKNFINNPNLSEKTIVNLEKNLELINLIENSKTSETLEQNEYNISKEETINPENTLEEKIKDIDISKWEENQDNFKTDLNSIVESFNYLLSEESPSPESLEDLLIYTNKAYDFLEKNSFTSNISKLNIIKLLIAKQPNITENTINLLIKEQDINIKLVLLKNENLPTEAIENIYENELKLVNLNLDYKNNNHRRTLAMEITQNPNTPEEIIKKLKDNNYSFLTQ